MHLSTGRLAVFADDSGCQAALAGVGGAPSIQHGHEVPAHVLMLLLRLLLLRLRQRRGLLHSWLLLLRRAHVALPRLLLLLLRLLAPENAGQAATSAGGSDVPRPKTGIVATATTEVASHPGVRQHKNLQTLHAATSHACSVRLSEAASFVQAHVSASAAVTC